MIQCTKPKLISQEQRIAPKNLKEKSLDDYPYFDIQAKAAKMRIVKTRPTAFFDFTFSMPKVLIA